MNKMQPYLFLGSLFFFNLFASQPIWAEQAKPQTRQIESLVFNCYTCHGTDGQSPGNIPSLKGQSAKKIEQKMLAFRQDKTPATIMNRIAKAYNEEEIANIADYLSQIK